MWCGTESGRPIQDVGGGPIWSTGGGHFGDANGTDWMPKFCDPQLFQEHVWFWEGEQKMMIFGIKNEELSIKTRNFVFRMMNLQGDTNRDVRDADGKCVNVSIIVSAHASDYICHVQLCDSSIYIIEHA